MAPSSHMATLDSDMFKCCHEVKTLGMYDDKQAHNLLNRAAEQVKPIMAKRNWVVPLLIEFYPDTPNLLGMNHNHGQKIEVRLRYANNENAFLPYEEILVTLLHELVHIEIGPHNAAFYKLMDELKAECEDLMARGITPPSADFANSNGDGNRLSYAKAPPKHIAQERAVEAATRRQKIDRLMSGRSQKLGGNEELKKISVLCDPREMALAAAQRRLGDDLCCRTAVGSSSSSSSRRPPRNTGKAEVIELDGSDDDLFGQLAALRKPKKQVEEDDEVEIVQENITAKPKPKPKKRVPASRIPTRDNAAALAALERVEALANRGTRRARR